MKIAFINGTRQSNRNREIFSKLEVIANKYNREVYNLGMYNDEYDLSYVEIGVLVSILINSNLFDFVITGCTSGQGISVVCNSFPNVICGHIENSYDAYSFMQVNAGNVVSIPFTDELNINYEEIFDSLLKEDRGYGYPKDHFDRQRFDRLVVNEIRNTTHKDFLTILKGFDKNMLIKIVNYKEMKELINNNSNEILDYLKEYIKRD